jgi:apolipoprotein N-acyltransferase
MNDAASAEPDIAPGTGLLDKTPPPEIFQRRLELRRRASVLLLCLLTAVLLLVSMPPFDLWYFGYVALVPLAMALSAGVHHRWTLLCSWLAGLGFWAMALYWLTLPTMVGYFGAVLYLSLYWLAAGAILRAALRRNWPMWLALPVVWVALEFVRSHLISFSWFTLAQTQTMHLPLIQLADVTGSAGVSFFVAMVNGAAADLLTAPLFARSEQRNRLNPTIWHGLAGCALALAGLLGYGHWRLSQPAGTDGPTVGIVQEAIPISLTGPVVPTLTFLQTHLAGSMNLIGAGCDLIIWPETMLPEGMNPELLEADLASLPDDDIRSISMQVYGRAQTDAHDVPTLRESLIRKVGLYDRSAYYPIAARYLLSQTFTPEILARLDQPSVEALGQLLFGPGATTLELPALRDALGLALPQYTPRRLSPADRATLAGCLGVTIAPETSSEQLGEMLRSTLARRIQRDEPSLKTLRCQTAMMHLASLLLDCPIMAGGTTLRPNPRGHMENIQDRWVRQNSVLWFTPDGWGMEYAKTHLVPFSEAVPLRYTLPAAYDLLRAFVPEAMPQLHPGDEFTHFILRTGPDETYQLVTPICYEGTVSQLCRRMVAEGAKDRTILVNLSNDGWFVSQDAAGQFRGTTEHAQHLTHYIFRAIENRVPVLRAVNTGISASIDSNGRIVAVLEEDDGDSRKRLLARGTMMVRPLVDGRIALYSVVGEAFGLGVTTLAAGLIVILIWKKRTEARTSH